MIGRKQIKVRTPYLDRRAVFVTTVYNIRNDYWRRELLRSFNQGRHRGLQVDLNDIPDDIEALKRRCANLEMNNVIFE